MTAVEVLREAAKLLRERATAATRGPWVADEWDALRYTANGAYIASMHPLVGLALADAFDLAIGEYVEDEDTGTVWTDCPAAAAFVTVARAYLGGDPT